MKNYREQTPRFRCANCNLRFVKHEHDEYPQWFCLDDAEPRPPCNSVEMNEARCCHDEKWDGYFDKEGEHYAIWDRWAAKHRVSENGICEHYEAT